jgi:transcription elongation factor Elf1
MYIKMGVLISKLCDFNTDLDRNKLLDKIDAYLNQQRKEKEKQEKRRQTISDKRILKNIFNIVSSKCNRNKSYIIYFI